ncbi:MAG: cyclopropane-fatty-acyl-phospholipid synthase family protein [Planctomycetota bacterium]
MSQGALTPSTQSDVRAAADDERRSNGARPRRGATTAGDSSAGGAARVEGSDAEGDADRGLVARATWLDGVARRAVLARLAQLVDGEFVLHEGGTVRRFGAPTEDGLTGHAHVHHPSFWRAIAFRGSIGSGEAFAAGAWSSPEPADVVRLFVRNHSALSGLERGLALLTRPALKAYHALRDNTRRGAAKNISAHYDLSNAFFELFLDPSMTYSSAYFAREDTPLEEAQYAKIDRLLAQLQLKRGDHLLEIGTGWGALACRAAATLGVRVTTTTLSREQHALAVKRVHAAGLSSQVEVLLQDYRDLTPPPEGRFDAIVSVEMIEAVGARHYPAYFAAVDRLLAPGGRFGMQAITIRDQHFERARREVDFIQRHIFPGSCIPSITALSVAARDASALRLVGMDDFGQHYARTLRLWRDALRLRRDDARQLGFDAAFLRLWDYYFSYCEGGFAEGHISVAHLTYSR